MFEAHVAEDVLPGHPDRLADGVAEAIVVAAVAHDPASLVGVEVAVHRRKVFVTGRVASGAPGHVLDLDLHELAARVYAAAGYTGYWELRPEVVADLDLGPLEEDERAVRGVSDDQSIVIGYATTATPTLMPPATVVARRLRQALRRAAAEHPDRLGPDGKVLVRLQEHNGRYAWHGVNVSVQHHPDVQMEELNGLVGPAVTQAMNDVDAEVPGLADDLLHYFCPTFLRINGAGDFSRGGPFGDNGLSGKKLVVDFYGPSVPIGGGALCGKDPHKVDRVGALRARRLAVDLLQREQAREVMVQLQFEPGLKSAVSAYSEVDGASAGFLSGFRLGQTVPIADEVSGLELHGVNWARVLEAGYFGAGHPWDSPKRDGHI